VSRCFAFLIHVTSKKSFSQHATVTESIHPLCKFNGIPLCACMKKGVLTLEAAVVFPFVAAFWACILMFFRILPIDSNVQTALVYAGRKAAATAIADSSEVGLILTAKANWLYGLQDEDSIEAFLPGGPSKVSFLGSEVSEGEIKLKINYTLKVPFSLFPGLGYEVSQTQSCKLWTGDETTETEEDIYVYVTDYGTAYHTSTDCSYLDLSIEAVEYSKIAGLRNVDAHKYYPCSLCAEENTSYKTVYITDYGTVFHTDADCPGLKRTIYMVHLSEVGNRYPCQKCAGGER